MPQEMFVVVAMLDPLEEGTTFERSQWPGHVTLASNFATTAPVEELVRVLRRAGALSAPLALRFGELAHFGPNGDIPVRLVEEGRASSLHRRMAHQLETLPGFAAEQPAAWHDGYRSHLTLTSDTSPINGESRSACCIATARLRGSTATIVASFAIPDLAEIDQVELEVALPSGAAAADAEVVACGSDEDFPSSITVRMPDGLTLMTSRQIGIRWRGSRWSAIDQHLADTARSAVFQALADRIPPDLPLPELRRRIESLEADATRIGALILDAETWSTLPVRIAEVEFALFTTTLDDGFAAVADIGSARITVTGEHLPDKFALQLVPARQLAWP